MVAQEGDRWTVSLSGRQCTRPPTDLDGFIAYARSCVSPAIAEAIEGLTPLDEGMTYRFPANRRRHYERLTEFPEGLLVTGDALCAFDPVYGQGMTVAALEAKELGRCLAEGRTDLARRFHGLAAEHIDTPWTIAVGAAPRAADLDDGPPLGTADGQRLPGPPDRRCAERPDARRGLPEGEQPRGPAGGPAAPEPGRPGRPRGATTCAVPSGSRRALVNLSNSSGWSRPGSNVGCCDGVSPSRTDR